MQLLRAENKEFRTNIKQLNEYLKDTKDELDDKQMVVFNQVKEMESFQTDIK
jgi:predicted  nucleic acid-binding Zn-ribbon protein